MINSLKDFLLNIFFILSPLVLYPYIYKLQNKKRVFLYVLFSIAIVSTMSFPVIINGLSYDFRSIPLTVGSLYGGNYVSIFLFATVLFYRVIIGSPNNLLYAISLAPTCILMIFLIKSYPRFTFLQKMFSAVIMSSVIKFVTFLLYLMFTDNLRLLTQQPFEMMKTYFLQALIICLYVYLIELLQKYFHMQEEIVNSEKMKMVSELAASVAHEIRNPLTTVKGFIQLLGTRGLIEEKKAAYQKICLEELERAQQIINDYLAFAKPEPEYLEKIEMNHEIDYVSSVLSSYASYNNVEIYVQRLDEEQLFILGDKNKLRQALINIGKNAIEAMTNPGILQFQLLKRNDAVALIVSDTGIGMTQEQINRLGTPYFSTKEKGTGLGTMVSFSIIKNMDGKIQVQSEIGKGTVYDIRFPAAAHVKTEPGA